MFNQRFKIFLIILLTVFVISSACISWYWVKTVSAIEQYSFAELNSGKNINTKALESKHAKPLKQIVKGLYLTAYSVASPKKVDEIISLINATELNAVVIDIKDYSGYVLYNSQVPLVNSLKNKEVRIKDIKNVINKFQQNHIYVIARQTIFQDPVLAEKKPEWAIKSKTGGVWHDNKGLSWVDPTIPAVWNYNMAIAKEAIDLGFDEMNFDYVRFPSDGDMSNVVYTNGVKPKYEIMHDFYHFVGEQLKNKSAWVSLDMFGLTMEATSTNDMRIGQRIIDAVGEVDYICPMMYPSHYPPGHLGLKNPADNPQLVFENGMKKGIEKFKNSQTEVRPWIQAFNLGAVYDGAKIRAQIDEVEKYANAGWLMWNAANRYTTDGLKIQ